MGGETICVDMGSGAAELHMPTTVKTISEALSSLTHAELKKAFDPEDMKKQQVYPSIWNLEEILETFLLRNFDELQEFYVKSAKNNEAIFLFMV